ncbi:glycan-binding surface protein [Flavitalea sp.]|nr:glycan-binding surface protein [Flavitalea sp.]
MPFTFRNIIKAIFVIAPVLLFLYSCKKDSNASAPPVIEFVRLVDSTKRDSTFTSSLTGQQILIHGQNLGGVQQILFNDMPASFNTALVTNTDIIVVVPATAPTEATNPNVSNKIRLITESGEASYDFKLVPPTPGITSVSNEMAFAGEVITIKGSVFYNLEKVVFPGNLNGTNLQVIDTATLRVTVPNGITTVGTIQVVGKYGIGENPNIIFNGVSQPGMLANFEDGDPQFGWAWWGGIKTNSSVDFPGNRGNYIRIKPAAAINANDGGWYSDNRAVNVAEASWIPESNLNDPIGDYLLKFEVFIKTPWKNGTILIRNEGSWKYTARYAPWLNSPNGTYSNSGWVTVSIPLTEFRTKANDVDGSGSPASSLSELLGNGKREVGFMLINDSSTPIAAFDAAFDNVRVVRR